MVDKKKVDDQKNGVTVKANPATDPKNKMDSNKKPDLKKNH
jgi:hypothetical protein